MKKIIYIVLLGICVMLAACEKEAVNGLAPPEQIYLELFNENGENLLDENVEGNIVGTNIKYVREGEHSASYVKWERPGGTVVVTPHTYEMYYSGHSIMATLLNFGAEDKFNFKLILQRPAVEYDVSIVQQGNNKSGWRVHAYVDGEEVQLTHGRLTNTIWITLPDVSE